MPIKVVVASSPPWVTDSPMSLRMVGRAMDSSTISSASSR